MERSQAARLRKQNARLAHKRAVRIASIVHNLKADVRKDVAALGGTPAEQNAAAAIAAAVATDLAALAAVEQVATDALDAACKGSS